MIKLPPMPAGVEKLPRDDRGYPVPWFVAWVDGKPEFRCARGEALTQAIRGNLCWVCGESFIDNILAFVIGPMCAVNRNTAEPPCHLECARFAAMACPFLAIPKAKRRESNMPEGTVDPAGMAIRRNPGVALIYITNRYRIHRERNGILFELPAPAAVEWYCEGRPATRDEVLESINTGLPILRKVADQDNAGAELDAAVAEAMKLLPQ